MNTLQSEIRRYAPAIVLDSVLPRTERRMLTRFLGVVLFLLGGIVVGYIGYDSVRAGSLDVSSLEGSARYFAGAFLILFGPYAVLLQLSFFYNTLYFRGLRVILREELTDEEGITQEVAAVCLKSSDDLTRGFITSSYGKEIMLRTGIDTSGHDAYLRSSRTIIHPHTLPLKAHSFLTLQDVGEYLLENDASFKTFLFAQGITPELFKGANEWVSRGRMLHKQKRQWWSKDNLGKIGGMGRDLSYGVAYELKRYMRSINTTSVLSLVLNNTAYANEVITKVETILSRSKAANVILVGEPGVGKMDMLIELGRRMREGHSVVSLSAKRLVVLDTDAFIATHNSKETFELAFLKLMLQTEHAGNIIVVIENISSFMASVAALGVDVGELLGRFLSSPDVQLVATIDPGSYHQSLEGNQEFLQHFSPVIIEKPDLTSTIRVLEEATWKHEHRYNIFFTYPALVRIAESADQYIVDGVMPDKAVSLLSEVASEAMQERRMLVHVAFVDACVSKKTGIPTGPVLERERELLVHLEDVLHERVVGQHAAIQAISSTMRRARAGIESKERPIGSFLFIGSTGVGKTETAKALAHVFFGNEDKMMRFDMSEFSDTDGLARLIGVSGKVGVLASALREHPYGVLLLDEFEKSAPPVRDLFLQILDEGMFTDARGTRINARNTIIIATSNAGSDMIWELMQSGKRPTDSKDEIINTIVERQIFKPELINRFDAVVIFEALGEVEQRKIASFMLKDLEDRISDRGYTLVINDVLLTVLMKEGYDPKFGARPMRRAIQDIIEEKIALKIIEGGLRPGDTIEFTEADFTETI